MIVSLTGWGLLFYGGFKFFTKGKKDNKEEVASYTLELWVNLFLINFLAHVGICMFVSAMF